MNALLTLHQWILEVATADGIERWPVQGIVLGQSGELASLDNYLVAGDDGGLVEATDLCALRGATVLRTVRVQVA